MNDHPSSDMDALLEIMARLRDPEGGCPWDLEQDFTSIAPYTIEEAYEVADAIVHADMDSLRDELGDLLFQVVFHARMAQEGGHFDFSDVAKSIVRKMIRRHPHVFADGDAQDPQQVRASWEAIKAQERAAAGHVRDSVMDGIGAGMPALLRAMKLQQRAASQGFDWPDVAGVMDKLREETIELEAAIEHDASSASVQQELGDLLFTLVNLARHLAADPEMALAAASARFEARFRHLEQAVASDGDGRALNERELEQLEILWQAAKKALAGGATDRSVSRAAPPAAEE